MEPEIGPISYGNRDNESFQKPFSEKTGEMLDAAVRKMVGLVHERTRALLTEHKDDVDKLAKMLLEKEVLTRLVPASAPFVNEDSHAFRYRDDLQALIGPRPFEDSSVQEVLEGEAEPGVSKPLGQPGPQGQKGSEGGLPGGIDGNAQPGLAAHHQTP